MYSLVVCHFRNAAQPTSPRPKVASEINIKFSSSNKKNTLTPATVKLKFRPTSPPLVLSGNEVFGNDTVAYLFG